MRACLRFVTFARNQEPFEDTQPSPDTIWCHGLGPNLLPHNAPHSPPRRLIVFACKQQLITLEFHSGFFSNPPPHPPSHRSCLSSRTTHYSYTQYVRICSVSATVSFKTSPMSCALSLSRSLSLSLPLVLCRSLQIYIGLVSYVVICDAHPQTLFTLSAVMLCKTLRHWPINGKQSAAAARPGENGSRADSAHLNRTCDGGDAMRVSCIVRYLINS